MEMAAGHRGKHAMVVRSLSFSYTPNVADSEVLQGVGFKVPFGARVVLVGLNGAGKSTLLSILAGQRMVPDGAVTVLGEDAFRGQAAKRRLVLISSEWTAAVAGMTSASAAELLAAAVERVCEDEREETATRGRQLAELLGVDGLWHVYALSEGQRRRLHLVIKLMPLYDVVLLDEATTDLDIVARRNLLLFLRADSAKRRATVIYCTHIFDGLEGWASHLALIHARRLARLDNCRSIPALSSGSLYDVVRGWLYDQAGIGPGIKSPHENAGGVGSLPALPRAAQGASNEAVAVSALSWGWGAGAGVGPGAGKLVLRSLSVRVNAGQRVVLAGANGAGKTSLLNILAGLHIISPPDAACVLGYRAFEDYRELNQHVVLLSQEWRQTLKCLNSGGYATFSAVTQGLIETLTDAGHDVETMRMRLDHLCAALEVDRNWQPGVVSDGQLRRMQLALKLMPPRSLVFLDEASVDLDIIGRQALLTFLKAESQVRGATIIYCTHIFDGLESWATDLVFVTKGAVSSHSTMQHIMAEGPESGEGAASVPGTQLYRAIQRLLYRDYNAAVARDKMQGIEGGGAAEHVERAGEQARMEGAQEGRQVEALPFGWTLRQSQGIYGAFGAHKWEAQEKISSEQSPMVVKMDIDADAELASFLPEEEGDLMDLTVEEEEARRQAEQQQKREALERERTEMQAKLEEAERLRRAAQGPVVNEEEALRLTTALKPALAALKSQVLAVEAAVETRDLAELAASRQQTGRLWSGLAPVLDAFSQALGASTAGGGDQGGVLAATALNSSSNAVGQQSGGAVRWWDGGEADTEAPMSYSQFLASKGQGAGTPGVQDDEGRARGDAAGLPWGFGEKRQNTTMPAELERQGKLMPSVQKSL